jgi:hypothetical protein
MSQVIDKKLFAAIDKLNDKQKKEVLVFVGSVLDDGEQNYEKWQDDSFVSEMETRYNHYKNGGKMVTAEEAEKRIKAIITSK